MTWLNTITSITRALGRLGNPLLFLALMMGPVVTSVAADNRADGLLQADIQRQLDWNAELAPYDLMVDVVDAVATLHGSVSNSVESRRARRIAEDTAGVVGVVNAVHVNTALVQVREGLSRPDDETLHRRIAQSLERDPRVLKDRIKIDVTDGHVQLTGVVPVPGQGVWAEQIVRSLYGVESVRNAIELID